MGHVFRHPNYYKQLKEKYEQEASSNKHGLNHDPDLTRRVGPEAGTKVQASSSKHQASSSKPQAFQDIRQVITKLQD
jgi:hypothetical protein